MSIRGIFTSDANIEGTRKKDFAGALLLKMPQGTAPLLALSSGMMSTDAKDTVVTWFEENYLSGRITCSTNATISTTAFVVSDIGQCVVSQIFLVEDTSEYVFVTAVAEATNTITVSRGFADTAATAKNGSSTPFGLQRIGTAHPEASDAPVAVANRGFPKLNYVQSFRNTWAVSGIAQKLEFRTGPIKSKNVRDCSIEHAGDIERSVIWGKRSYGVKDGQNFFTMDGLRAQIKSNTETTTNNVSYKTLRNFLQKVFQRNIRGKPNERIAFCGNSVINSLDDILRADGNVQVFTGATEFGFKVRRLITPYGDISLMTHPMMVESPLWTKDLMVLHPGSIELKWVRRQMWDNYDRDGTRAGKDSDYGVVTSDLTICIKAEETAGYFSGITGGIAS